MTALRRATLVDAVAIRDLTRAAYAKWVPLIGCEPLPMRVGYSFYARRGFQEFQREPFPAGWVTVYMKKMIKTE